MNLVVCLKQILDPEIPARDFRIDRARLEAERGSAKLVLNIFCGNALETALQFRERQGGQITALSHGPSSAEEVLRKALALNVDEAVLIVNGSSSRPAPLQVAQVLAAGIKRRGAVDLVLVGRESGDWGEGQTGGLLAEELGWPCVSFVVSLAAVAGDSRRIRLRRQTEEGTETVEAQLPVVVTVTNSDCNLPRIPKTRDVMQSARKPLLKWTSADLGLEPGQAPAYSTVVELRVPLNEKQCEFITGATLAERIDRFARRLAEVVRSA